MTFHHSNDILNRKIAEYTYGVLKAKPNFHINPIVDVSPYCDCHSENDVPIVPNIGMLASFDPVALDLACIDLVNEQSAVHNSRLEENIEKLDKNKLKYVDNLTLNHPDTNWRSCIEHAVKIGLGNDKYELIKI